jgi:hypothetical protein
MYEHMTVADDSTATTGGTPDSAASTTVDDAGATGSKQGALDDSTLASRYAGQTAKVNELSGQVEAAKAAEAAALQKLADYEAGKVGSDEALKAQLEAAQAATKAALQDAALARIEAKYPETFSLFGAAAAGMPAEVLAASEARLVGVTPESEPPTPGSPNKNSTSTATTKKVTEESADDVQARLISGPKPW